MLSLARQPNSVAVEGTRPPLQRGVVRPIVIGVNLMLRANPSNRMLNFYPLNPLLSL
ncbi:MAG: hypothetical protein K6T90_11425 [Leptolyngbyaceae cyanobacterium HOT.MB2.61]|nr:hypothetical protein [Leptolyngbyaceae cyanobacterium HOT.MB2.61]